MKLKIDEICDICNRPMLEHELKHTFIKRMKKIDKQKGIPFKDINDLRQQREDLK